MSEKKLSERIKIDDENDIMTIDGVKFSGHVLEWFYTASKPHDWFRIVGVQNGAVTVETKREEPKV